MKSIEWQQVLREQKENHGKIIFTVTELCHLGSMSHRSHKEALRRLVTRGILERYVSGRYGMPGAVTPEELVVSLDSTAYITGMRALQNHSLVTQVPTEITCFTMKRHNRSRVRSTPVGRLVFVTVSSGIYLHPKEGVLAPAEQAMCDFVYLCRRRGVRASSLVTFRNLERLSRRKLRKHLKRYPSTVDAEIEELLG